MNDLINLLTNRVGITQDKAQQAVNVVLSYVKENLPAPVSNQIENLIGTSGLGSSHTGSSTSSTGGSSQGNIPGGGTGGSFGGGSTGSSSPGSSSGQTGSKPKR